MRAILVPVLALCACRSGTAPDASGTSAATTDATTGGVTTTTTTTTSAASSSSTAAASDEGTSTTGSARPSMPTCPSVRSEVDRPDADDELPEVQVLYVIPSDGTDLQLDTNERICNSVLAWNDWLAGQTAGRRLHLDVADGELDIGFVRLERTDAEIHGSEEVASIETGVAYVRERIERELILSDWLQDHELAAVYYGGTSEYACGGGAWPPVLEGRVAALYLGGRIAGFDACDGAAWGEPEPPLGYLDYAMLHEIMHTLGLVGATAEHQHTSGHVFDPVASPERDLMYSQRPAERDPPWGVYDGRGLELDLGRDDYFEHGKDGVPDLARSALLEPLPEDPELPPGW